MTPNILEVSQEDQGSANEPMPANDRINQQKLSTMDTSCHVTEIEIEHISAPSSERRMSERAFEELKDSIIEIGLLEPVIIKKEGDYFRLLAGQNRFEACKALGRTHILAHMVEVEGEDAQILEQLIVLDENLCRAELTELELAEALVEKKDIYEQLYPETTQGKAPKGKDPLSGSKPHQPSFLDDTVDKTGKGRSTIAESIHIGKHLDETVKNQLRGTTLENRKKDLLALSRMTPKDQKMIVEILEGNKTLTLSQAKRESNISKPSRKKDNSIYNDGAILKFLENIEECAKKRFEKYEESSIENLLSCDINKEDLILTICIKGENL